MIILKSFFATLLLGVGAVAVFLLLLYLDDLGKKSDMAATIMTIIMCGIMFCFFWALIYMGMAGNLN